MFLDLIIIDKNMTVPSFSEQVMLKKKDEAEKLFNETLSKKVQAELKKLNHVFTSEAEFDTFVTDRLAKISIAETETTAICLDITVDSGTGAVTDIGTKLVEWEGTGYYVGIPEPDAVYNTFE